MATWQVHLRLVPRAALVNAFGRIPASISRAQYESTDWWINFDRRDDMANALESVAPARDVWSRDMRGWGVDDGNRVDLWQHDSRIADLSVRVDAREPDQFTGKLAEFAAQFDLMLISDAFEIRPPSSEQIRLELFRSPARQFLQDPERYLRDLDDPPRIGLD